MDAVELLTCIKEDKIDGNSENEAEQTEICFICNEILTDQVCHILILESRGAH